MDTEARKTLYDEHTNDCRSMGSNIHPSSQSRKISIGVMADSKANSRCGDMKRNNTVMPSTERITSKAGNITGGESKAEGAATSSKVKQIGGPKGVEGSWMSKSFYQKTSTCEMIRQANQTSSLLVSPGGQGEPDGIGSQAGIQIFSNQTSNIPSNNYKKVDGNTSGSSRRKDGIAEERADEFTFATTAKVFESDKTMAKDKINRTENKTENLRMKLFQILGTTSSPKTQASGSHTCNNSKESLPQKLPLNQKDNEFKGRQNSDTIETDSENPGHTRKRPVTRSRTRKKASSQKQRGKSKSDLISRDKEKHQEKSILSFAEKGIGGRDAFSNDGSSVSLKKKSQGKNSQIGRRKICFTENYTTDKLHPDTSKTDPPLHAGAPFSLGNKIGGFSGFLSDYQTKSPRAQKKDQENEFYQPQTVNNTDQRVKLDVSENRNQQECRSIPVTQNVAKSQDDFQSPTFQFKTPTLSSPRSTPKTDQKANDVNSPTSTERTRFSMRTIPNLWTSPVSELDFTTREQDKSYHTKEHKCSIPGQEKSFVKETKEQYGSSDSSSDERNTAQGCNQGSRARHTAERKSFSLHPIKKLCKHKGIKFNDKSQASVSSREIGESHSMDEAYEQNQDGFVRAVELFALELAKLKNKLKLMTSQKSSEILKSVAEDIHFQLQDVHSQIQTDLGKLTILNKSKRKRIETRFEDQQKQLRLIYDRFKEEVNLHLQDCKSTVEDLEADQIEIKGTLEKQRVAHKKLLSHVEESVEVQLNDAQKKITSTQEMARGKLLQLKHVITMCLKEDI